MISAFRRLVPLAAAAILLGTALPAAAQSPRDGNGDTEREIRAVRAVYQEVTQAVAANRLTRTQKSVRCHKDDLGEAVTAMTDASGRVRQLTIAAGTDDQAETQRFYYDSAGRLRFIFVTRGAVNGTEEEERIYYASDRRVLRRTRTKLQGPGYFFSPATPIWRPAEWVRDPCPDRHRSTEAP